jgi:hypothetical protein
MAHHIASLLDAAESATGQHASELRRQCASEILKLWGHRSNFPGDDRPLGSLDSVLRTLSKMDPERPEWEAYRAIQTNEEVEGLTGQLLSAAELMDKASTHAIRALLSEAAMTAHDAEILWIEAAPKPEPSDALAVVFRDLGVEMGAASTNDDRRIRSLKKSIGLLDALIHEAEIARSVLQERLEGR